MNNKIKVFLDFDDTITLSAKRFVEIANKKFNMSKNWRDVKIWKFLNLYPYIKESDVLNIFESDEFFDGLQLQENCSIYVDKLKEISDIYIITKGSKINTDKKKNYVKNRMNLDIGFERFLSVTENESKGIIDMSNSIFVDDRLDNLLESNAEIKILYKNNNNFPWQRTYDRSYDNLYITNTWEEIYSLVNFFINNPEFIKREV